MHTVLSEKNVVARKEYYDACMDHLDFGIITRVAPGKWGVNLKEAEDLQLTQEEINVLQAACDKNFRILPGELHKYQSGIYDGDFYSVRCSIALCELISKKDWWIED